MKMAQKQETIAAFPIKASPVTWNVNAYDNKIWIIKIDQNTQNMSIWMTVMRDASKKQG